MSTIFFPCTDMDSHRNIKMLNNVKKIRSSVKIWEHDTCLGKMQAASLELLLFQVSYKLYRFLVHDKVPENMKLIGYIKTLSHVLVLRIEKFLNLYELAF